MGVGPVPPGADPADFVLDRFSADERKRLPELFASAAAGVGALLTDGFERAMNLTNKVHV